MTSRALISPPIKYQQGTITGREQLSKRVQLLKIAPECPFEWIPGQWIITKTIIEDKDRIADYTIVSSPQLTSEFEIMVDNYPGSIVGQIMHNTKIGGTFTFKAPRGRFLVQPGNPDLIFVWQDIGIAAGIPLLQQLANEKFSGNISILNFLTDDFEDLYPLVADRFDNLAINYTSITSKELDSELVSTGNIPKKQMAELFSRYVGGFFYISGKSKFVIKIRQKFISIGVDKERILREGF